MAHEPTNPVADPAVAQWGADDPPRTGRTGRLLAALARDHRLVPVVGGLSALAVLASFVGEWAVYSVPLGDPDGVPATITNGLTHMGNLGMGYLLGIFPLAGCVVLARFGSSGIRPNTRLVGLTLGGLTLGILVATQTNLEQIINPMFGFGSETELTAEQGRGLLMAFVGTIGFTLAIFLTGRPGTAVIRPPTPATDDEPERGDPADGDSGDDWPWRRPRREREAVLDEPTMDVTVTPATPFIRPDHNDIR